jgi:hypothetical protein
VRVLVVEDEARMATLLERGLREEGYSVDVAVDGTNGLWLATEQEYDAIVLDALLPGLGCIIILLIVEIKEKKTVILYWPGLRQKRGTKHFLKKNVLCALLKILESWGAEPGMADEMVAVESLRQCRLCGFFKPDWYGRRPVKKGLFDDY